MIELFYVIAAILVVTGAMALVTIKAELFMRFIEDILTYCSVALILGVMLWVVSEVIARYVFNSPLPGHLEGAELLLPMIVFFGVSYVQARDGHVGMTFVVDALPKKGPPCYGYPFPNCLSAYLRGTGLFCLQKRLAVV